jgi:hypothetical protein
MKAQLYKAWKRKKEKDDSQVSTENSMLGRSVKKGKDSTSVLDGETQIKRLL